MATRPYLPARDSSGRNVSLLNDEPTAQPLTFRPSPYNLTRPSLDSASFTAHGRTLSYASDTSSPSTPDLLRSDSYDSHDSQHSPVTPTSTIFEFAPQRQGSYSGPSTGYAYSEKAQSQRPAYVQRTSTSFSSAHARTPSHPYPAPSHYPEAHSPTSTDGAVSSNRRYPCRFKDLHNCDKTFTTSGHASRHSKIHTAEKAVHCSFAGCTKKFTRADNMKQHLETHYKERVRPQKAAPQVLTTRLAGLPSPRKSHEDSSMDVQFGRGAATGLDALAAAASYEVR